MRQPTEGTRDPDALLDAILARTEPLPLPEAARQALVSLLADAPFASRRTGVPTRLRGLLVDGMPLRATESSLRAHLAKRMFDSAQWTTTTTAEYLADLRATIQHPDAVLHVYLLEGEAHIGVVGRRWFHPHDAVGVRVRLPW